MTPKNFYQSNSKETIEQVCRDAETTLSNFKQIALAGGSCSSRLAERLAVASSGRMTELEILYPERFGPIQEEA